MRPLSIEANQLVAHRLVALLVEVHEIVIEDARAVIILSSVYHGIHLEAMANSEEPQRKIGFTMGKEKEEGEKEDASED